MSHLVWCGLFSFYRRGKTYPVNAHFIQVTKLVSTKIKKQEDSKSNQLSPNSVLLRQQRNKFEILVRRRGDIKTSDNLRNTMEMKRKLPQDTINEKSLG